MNFYIVSRNALEFSVIKTTAFREQKMRETQLGKRSNILLFSICLTQTTSRDSIIIRASPNIVTNPDRLRSIRSLSPSLFRPPSLAKHYARHLMRLMQSSDAFNPANLHCALISCASIPLMESLMRNRNILLARCCFRQIRHPPAENCKPFYKIGPSLPVRKFAFYLNTLFALFSYYYSGNYVSIKYLPQSRCKWGFHVTSRNQIFLSSSEKKPLNFDLQNNHSLCFSSPVFCSIAEV